MPPATADDRCGVPADATERVAPPAGATPERTAAFCPTPAVVVRGFAADVDLVTVFAPDDAPRPVAAAVSLALRLKRLPDPELVPERVAVVWRVAAVCRADAVPGAVPESLRVAPVSATRLFGLPAAPVLGVLRMAEAVVVFPPPPPLEGLCATRPPW